MDAPDTIYVPKSKAVEMGERLFADDIPYHRAKTCVWNAQDDPWYSVEHNGVIHTDYKIAVERWTLCPYCGGHIEIQKAEHE